MDKLIEINRFRELKIGDVIRRIEAFRQDYTPDGIEQGEDYRLLGNDEGEYTLERLLNGKRIKTYLSGNERRYRQVVQEPAPEPTKVADIATSELDRFEAIYRILEAKGVESSKAVRSALEIIRTL